MKIEIKVRQGSVNWLRWKTPDTGRWIAVCEPLGLTVQADAFPELNETIADSVNALLLDLFEDNELDRFLSERGWEHRESSDEDRRDEIAFRAVS